MNIYELNRLSQIPVRIIYLIFCVFFLSGSLMAQKKNNLDTPDIYQRNPDMHKAIAIRKAGIVLTFSGIGIIAAGGITSIIMVANKPDDPDEDPWDDLIDLVPVAMGGLAGLTFIAVGFPMKIIGDRRINKYAEFSLKTFDIKQKNSIALGMGITLSF